jgi:hypothetical protein
MSLGFLMEVDLQIFLSSLDGGVRLVSHSQHSVLGQTTWQTRKRLGAPHSQCTWMRNGSFSLENLTKILQHSVYSPVIIYRPRYPNQNNWDAMFCNDMRYERVPETGKHKHVMGDTVKSRLLSSLSSDSSARKVKQCKTCYETDKSLFACTGSMNV